MNPNYQEQTDQVQIENEDEIRERIRQRIREKMQRNGNIKLNDKMKKQLRDEIKQDMFVKESKRSFFDVIFDSPDKKALKVPANIHQPGPSHQPQYDEEKCFQEQLKLAIEMSKMDMGNKQEEAVSQVNDESQIECAICLEITTSTISYGCEHKFCAECVTNVLDTAINDGLLDSMKCPDPGCNEQATVPMIQKLVSKQMFERYENLSLRAAVADMDNIVYCSNGECGAIVEAETDIGIAICHKCGNTFCTNCLKPFHGTSDCELNDNERHEMLQMYQDELVAEELLQEESLNQFAIEAAQIEDEEWLKQIREEQNAIRLQEQSESEELERQQEESRLLEAKRVEAEEKQHQKERLEYERSVQQNQERERQEQLRRESRRKQDMESENTVKQTSKPCPSCKSPIEKNGGCVHMSCAKCRYEFCWTCMGRWSHDHTCSSLFSFGRR